MGRRGPKPEPASVKRAKGNPGRRRIGSDPVAAESVAISVKPPAWLKGEGLKVWKRLAPRLAAMKLLGQMDAETFARYCRNFARWFKMQKVLDQEGETYESESAHGKLKRAHPAYLISDRLERQLLAAEDRFGLNPAERQRLFAARAARPPGDLFPGEPASGEPAQPAAAAAPPSASKRRRGIGLLN